jgi:hypothetical protein
LFTMIAPSLCPSASRLERLLAETPANGATPIPSADQAQLILHLDHCTSCQRRLDDLAGANPALLEAARALRGNSFANEDSLRRVLDEVGNNVNLLTQYYDPDNRITTPPLLPASLNLLGPLDDYEITEVLGLGGMGQVLKAYDRALKRWVAIKVLGPHVANDPVARLRFAREAQGAAAVRHENVITIHAVRESGGLPYFVMEYVSGGSLQDYLDRGATPNWRTVARLGAEMAAGLAAAHARGLIHRDVKPSNILLQESAEEPGTVKISDFGLVRVADESRLTLTGVIAGTPMYMAPEQVQGEELDARADLFGLGSVLYTLCTGREPFHPRSESRHSCLAHRHRRAPARQAPRGSLLLGGRGGGAAALQPGAPGSATPGAALTGRLAGTTKGPVAAHAARRRGALAVRRRDAGLLPLPRRAARRANSGHGATCDPGGAGDPARSRGTGLVGRVFPGRHDAGHRQ